MVVHNTYSDVKSRVRPTMGPYESFPDVPVSVERNAETDTTSTQRLFYVRDEYGHPENVYTGPIGASAQRPLPTCRVGKSISIQL